MSNRKKLKSQKGATRIVPTTGKSGCLYGVQYYDGITESWKDVEGCSGLTRGDAVIARKNYVALRDACKMANGASLHINVPADEVYGN